MRLTSVVLLLFLATAGLMPGQGIITTMAGVPFSSCGFLGDGGPATSAQLCNAQSPTVDASGNIYFYDWGYNRIRKIAPDGIITTIAGNGTSGTAGDGGPAILANLGGARQLAWTNVSQDTSGGGTAGAGGGAVSTSGAGHLCFGDLSAHKIRCMSLDNGIIQGYGTGLSGFGGLGDGGPVTGATFNYTEGIAFDPSGNLYISDFGDNRVRKVDGATGIITTFAGPGPGYCCVPVGDGGPATSADLYEPMGLAYSNGGLYIADAGNFRVRRVDLTTNIITTVAGDGSFSTVPDGMPATSGGISTWWIAADTTGNLFLGGVRMVDTSGIITTIAGQPGTSGWGADDIPATQTVFGGIDGLGWDPVAQRLLISDTGTRMRQIFYTPATTTTLTSSKNPALPTETVTFHATVSPGDSTGNVRFYTGYGSGTLLGSSPLVNGDATISWTAPIGSSTTLVRAVYGGDATHNLSQSSTLTETAQLAATSTALVSSLNPSVQGQGVTFTATVTPPDATGIVAFLNSNASLGSATIQNGVATLTTATLPAGSNSIHTSYNGDSRYSGSLSPALIQVVKGSTSTTLSANPNPSVTGMAVTLTAIVTPPSATGSAQFFNGAVLLGSANLSGGQAQMMVSNLPAGIDSLTAVYSGDANNTGSTSPALAQVVKNSTTTSLTSNPNPSTFGSAVSLTATVTPASATGAVQFFNGGTLLGFANLINGKAQLSIASLPAGSDSLTALYGGDANNASSTSAPGLQAVNKATSTTTLSANPASQANSGQVVTFTAKVTPAAATGVVQFLDGSTLIGSAALNNGTAVFSTSTLANGIHTIKASYGGDSNVNGGQSAALSYKVKH